MAGEFAIVFTMYNLRRAMSILGVEELIKRIESAYLFIIERIGIILSCLAEFLFILFWNQKITTNESMGGGKL